MFQSHLLLERERFRIAGSQLLGEILDTLFFLTNLLFSLLENPLQIVEPRDAFFPVRQHDLFQVRIFHRVDDGGQFFRAVAVQRDLQNLRAVVRVDDQRVFKPLNRVRLVANCFQFRDSRSSQCRVQHEAAADHGLLSFLIREKIGVFVGRLEDQPLLFRRDAQQGEGRKVRRHDHPRQNGSEQQSRNSDQSGLSPAPLQREQQTLRRDRLGIRLSPSDRTDFAWRLAAGRRRRPDSSRFSQRLLSEGGRRIERLIGGVEIFGHGGELRKEE